jgi:hypothetical protein
LNSNKNRYWNIEDQRPYQLLDLPCKALPSDSAYREDLIYRKMGDFTKGQVREY